MSCKKIINGKVYTLAEAAHVDDNIENVEESSVADSPSVVARFSSAANYIEAKRLVFTVLNHYYVGENFRPLTYTEAIKTARTDLMNYYAGLLTVPEEQRNEKYEKELLFYKDLLSTDPVNGGLVFDSLIEALLPSTLSIDKFDEVFLDDELKAELDELEGLDKANLFTEIANASRINNETKLSDKVKLLFFGIQVRDKAINPRFAYVMALQLMGGINNNLDGSFIEKIDENLELYGASNNEAAKAVRDVLVKVYEGAYKELPFGEFRDENHYVHKDVLVYRQSEQSTDDFLNNILDALKGVDNSITKENLEAKFIQHTQQEIFRELFTLFASQKESNLYIGHKVNDYGVYKYAYKRANIRSDDLHSKAIELAYAIEEAFLRRGQSEFTQRMTKGKVNMILKSLLRLQLTSNRNDNIASNELLEIHKAVIAYVTKINEEHKALAKENPLLEFETPTYNIAEFLLDLIPGESGQLKRLTTVSNYYLANPEVMRNTAVRDAEGRKFYKWHNADPGRQILIDLVRNLSVKYSKQIPKHLQASNMQFNPYVKGMVNNEAGNKFDEVIDHDKIITTALRSKTTSYSKEGDPGHIERTFILGFLSMLEKQSKNLQYVQFVATPSNRGRTFGVKTDFLNYSDLQINAELAIKQILNRPKFLNVKNYDRTRIVDFGAIIKALRAMGREDLIKDELHLDESFFESDINIKSLAKEVLKAVEEAHVEEFEQAIFANAAQAKYIKSFADEGLLSSMAKVDEKVSNLGFSNSVQAYVLNHYFNSYFLNQLIAGEQYFFKNSSDFNKRLQGATSPGQRGLVDGGVVGMRNKFKIQVLSDVAVTATEDNTEGSVKYNSLKNFLEKVGVTNVNKILALFPKDYELTDAQGFMSMRRYQELLRGFGNYYKQGFILKPAYYGFKEVDGVAHQVMLKWSSIVLTDNFVGRNRELTEDFKKIRDYLEANEIDEVIFSSGVKVGASQELSSFYDIVGNAADNQSLQKGVLELDNEQYRLQLNPSTTSEKKVNNPTQLSYFIGALKGNETQAKAIYEALGKLIDLGTEEFTHRWRSGKNRLIESLLRGPSSEYVHTLFTGDGNPEFKVSKDYPVIANKIVQLLVSKFNKETVEVNFPGSKLVLQSSVGIKYKGRTLSYVEGEDGRLYAEVVLPSRLARNLNLKEGDLMFADALGFRIPSSELHSAVALKIVDVYDEKSGYDTNAIIAPPELVPLHGSDFDVDSLFVIRRSLNKQKEPIGYRLNNGVWELIDEDAFIETNPSYEDLKSYYKNVIIENFLEVVTAKRNRDRMITPISFEYVKSKEGPFGMLADLFGIDTSQKGWQDLLLSNNDHSSPLGNLRAYRSNFDGLKLTGIFANSIKVLSYILKSQSKKGTLSLKAKNTLELKLSDGTVKVFDTFKESEELLSTLDGLLNAAIDNVKEQILPVLNLNSRNVNDFVSMLAMGVPINDAVKFMYLPQLPLGFGENINDYIRQVKENLTDSLSSFTASEKQQIVNGLELLENETFDVNLLNEFIAKNFDPRKPQKFPQLYDPAVESFILNREFFETPEDVVIYLRAMKLMHRIKPIGNTMFNFSQAFKLIKSYPSDFDSLLVSIDSWEKVFERVSLRGQIKPIDGRPKPRLETASSNVFEEMPNFFLQNPHLLSVYRNAFKIRGVVQDFLVNSETIRDIADLTKAVNKKSFTSKEIRNEFIRYMLSGHPRIVEIDNTPGGRRKFIQSVAREFKEFKRNNPTNEFVKNVTFGKNNVLQLNNGYQLDEGETYAMMRAYREMPEQLQNDLLITLLFDYGLEYGTKSFSRVIPPEIHANMDKEIKTIVKEKLPALRKHLNAFEIQLALLNPDHVDIVSKVEYDSGTHPLFGYKYDAIISKDRLKYTNNKYVKVTNKFGTTIFRVLPHDSTNDIDSDIRFLAKVGTPPKKGSYMVAENYDPSAYFNTNKRYVRVNKMDDTEFKSSLDVYEEGELIYIVDFNDILRINRKLAKIVKKKTVSVNKRDQYIHEYEFLPNNHAETQEVYITEHLESSKVLAASQLLIEPKGFEAEFGFQEGQEFSAKELLELYRQKGNPVQRQIAEKFLSLGDVSNIKIYIDNAEVNKEKAHGFYKPGSNSIYLHSDEEMRKANKKTSEVLLHELIHAMTFHVLHKPTSELTADQLKAKGELEMLRQEVKRAFIQKGIYNDFKYRLEGSTSKRETQVAIDEFVAGALSDVEFQKELMTLVTNKKETFLAKVFEFIKKLLGISSGNLTAFELAIDRALALSSLPVVGQSSDIIMLKEETAEPLGEEIYNENIQDFQNFLSQYEDLKLTDDEENYVDNEGNTFNRVSNFKNEFVALPRENDPEKRAREKALKIWGQRDLEKTIDTTNYGEVSFEEYVEKELENINLNRLRGTAIHALLRAHIHRLQDNDKGYRDAVAEAEEIIKQFPTTRHFDAFRDFKKVKTMLQNAKINIADDINADNIGFRDIISPETKIKSKTLGYAGTIDVLVRHSDGTHSIVDWKTGKSFLVPSQIIMQYSNEGLTASEHDLAKLQVMLYAFMLKVENPDMLFRNLLVMWMPSEQRALHNSSRKYVEVGTYLRMIENYLRQTDIKKYQEIKAKSPNAFNIDHYTTTNTETINGIQKSRDVNTGYAVSLMKQKLREIMTQYPTQSKMPPEKKKLVAKLTSQIYAYEKMPGVQLDEAVIGEDLTLIQQLIATFGDITQDQMPYFSEWHRKFKAHSYKASKQVEKKVAGLRAFTRPLVEEYLEKKGGFTRGVTTITRKRLQNIDYDELYSPLLRINEQGYHEFKAYDDPSLTKTQQNFIKYYQDTLSEYFEGADAFLNQKVMKGKTYLELLNARRAGEKFIYDKSFFPKTAITEEEVRIRIRKEKGYFAGFKDYMKFLFNRLLTTFYEDSFEHWASKEDLIPIKYLGNVNIHDSKNYSLNLEYAFEQFVRNIEYKKELDHVVAAGRGLMTMMELAVDPVTKETRFPRAMDYMNIQMKNLILDRPARLEGTVFEPLALNSKGKQYKLSAIKLTQLFSTIATAPIMWLKPINGMRNGIFAWMINAKEGAVNSIASMKFAGISNSAIDFGEGDLALASAEVTKSAVQWALNPKQVKQQDKIWLLARQLNFLPENLDWYVNHSDMLSERNPLFSYGNLYMFHSYPEEWNALTVMVAQLKSLKLEDGTSVWDNYEVIKREVGKDSKGMPTYEYKLEWSGKKRGVVLDPKGNVSKELYGLEPEEISHMQAIYRKMHGNYRQDEKIYIEAFALGRLFIQFKKYLPTILFQATRRPGTDPIQGKYELRKDENGKPVLHEGDTVYDWVARVNEGRWRVLIKYLASFFGASKNYRYSNLSDDNKKAVIDGYVSALMFLFFVGLSHLLFPDDDEDNPWETQYWIIFQNATQHLNPLDIARSLNYLSPASLKVLYESMDANLQVLSSLFYLIIGNESRAFTQSGDLRGLKPFLKNIPIISSIHETLRFVEAGINPELDFIADYR